MNPIKAAVAGTLESSDALISVEPGGGSLSLSIQSSVQNQYGKQIRQTLMEELARLEVTDARISIVDKGALDCTLRARLQCAIFRGCEIEENYPWGGLAE